MPFGPCSFLLLVVRPGALVASLLLILLCISCLVPALGALKDSMDSMLVQEGVQGLG